MYKYQHIKDQICIYIYIYYEKSKKGNTQYKQEPDGFYHFDSWMTMEAIFGEDKHP